MKIEKFDKPTCRKVGDEVEAAMKVIAEKHGLLLERRGGSFDEAGFKPTFEFKVPGEIGVDKRAENDFQKLADLVGLKADMLGKTFRQGRETYKITGMAPGRSKNCVKIMRLSDKSPRVCSPGLVLSGTFID